MKTCFINPPVFPLKKIMRDFDCAGESKANYLYQPYDFLLMSAFVPSEWEFHFIDAIASQLTHEDCFSHIYEMNPSVIVCSAAGINWEQDLKTIKKLRTSFPDAFLFIFGDLFIDQTPRLEVNSFVDGIFSSPLMFDFSVLKNYRDKSEFSASKYEAFYKEDAPAPKNLKAPVRIKVPIPKHDHFGHKAYRWPFAKSYQYTTIFTSWGCPYSCSYCILNKFPNYWRDYKEVIQEMIEVKKMGYKEIYIGDKSFGLPLPNIVSLLDEMTSLNLDLSWSTYFHPNQYSQKLLNKMKMAGCHTIIIGIETKNLNELKKYGRHVREDQLKDLLNYAHEIGMEVCGDFIIGLPHDNETTINELIEYACSLKIDYASFNIATPLPGSSIRELAISTNVILPHEQQFDSSGHNNVLSLTALRPEEIILLKNKAVKKFYGRPSYLLNRLSKIRDAEHLKIQIEEGFEVMRSTFRKSS